MLRIGYIFLLSFILFVSGLLIPKFVILDSSFGLAYYVLDLLGLWKPGLYWIIEHRISAIFCFFIFPIFVSFFFSIIAVIVFEKLWKTSKQTGLLFIFVVFILIYGLHTSDYNGVSYFGYWNSNY